ncbi:chitobiase/beta-hexosaminidase C-terminal domain-containing protein [Occallatibacter savannae]|uniref:chitobiase/beta-hexosaminidase C-terminal domain-containing protein n=1 Tax=Occallatibacter savannae TaxID=1002691 RepID=UPI000D692C7A|nr:chitobiase/beta-hexosaminidase C-terminal domain-containing protein [Occallatibacter savannae]
MLKNVDVLPYTLRSFRCQLFKPSALAWAILSSLAYPMFAQSPTPVAVPTWRYDLSHAGQNTSETALNPSNVNPASFGKLFSLPVDSTVYAQPLYIPGLTMSDGQVHNVLFVATENDSIYAFDADSNGGSNAKPIWQISLLSSAYGAASGAVAVPWQDNGSPDVAPTVGITGTPAIDVATNTMFVVGSTKENGSYFSRLHAISIITGKEQPNSPVNITATVAGTGNGSSNGQLSFSALWENQRPALNFYNGYVYIGYAAHGDNGPWHGWLFAYNSTTLQQTDVLCLSPNGVGAGIWASGAGLPIDTGVSGGRMYIVTGNGTRTSTPPFTSGGAYGESVVAFSLANGKITPVDVFTPFNYQTLNSHDWDQGSGGLLMPPDQPGSNPHMLITAGKEGRILVLNRDNLGGYVAGTTYSTNALQDITGVVPQAQGFWSTPAYWNGNVYMWAEQNVPMLFKLNGGVLDTQPDSKSSITSAFPDPTFSISSDGTQNGIAWAVRSDQFNTKGPGVLYAWNANDLTSTIYQSDANPARDNVGPANKFSVPVVTNGKVYVAAQKEVDVFGLLNGQPFASAPVISPNGGAFTTAQSVTLTSSTPSAAIYYTLDGSTPTPASTSYTGAISVSTDATLKAIASAPGYVQSSISAASFTFSSQTAPVTFSPGGGTYGSAQNVMLSDADSNAKIYYTADGSTPSASSALYSGPIQVTVSQTIKAIAIDPNLQNSNISSGAYVIQVGGNSINFSNGFSSTTGLQFNGSAVASNDTRLQLTNGGLNEAGSVFWNTPINVQAFTTTFQFQLSNAQGNGFTFTIQNSGPTALGGNSAGLGYQNIPKSVAVKFNFYNYNGEGSDSTGFYTNGQAPVTPTVDVSPSGIQLGSGDSIQATISYTGSTLTLKLLDLVTNKTFTYSQSMNIPAIVGGNLAYVGFTGGTGGLSASQKLVSWTYTTQAVRPAFLPGGGTYSSQQNVKLTSQTPDAVIYYTTDGSTPTPASNQYTRPITVASSETIRAIAVSPTLGTSVVSGTSYVIQASTSNASFMLSGSTFTITWRGGSIHVPITVTPKGGFTGAVPLTCSVVGPSGAISVPTCTVSTQPPAITGTAPVKGYVYVQTAKTTTIGNYTLQVQGTHNGLNASAKIPFAVQ